MPTPPLDEVTLRTLEREHAGGLTSAGILDVFARAGVPLSEATLRKYVQLGLLPRSTRVGRKGKHQGSQGIYPVGVVRQIVVIKELMADDLTIEDIQRDVLFMRADLQALEETLERVFHKLDGAVKERTRAGATAVVAREVGGARSLSRELLTRLADIEQRLVRRPQDERQGLVTRRAE